MFAGLALLTAAGRYLDVNPTAIALVFLIAVLFASAYWGLRYAVVLSIVATACFNFFFLPPLYTFTIADPQNWIALVAFLVTALVAGIFRSVPAGKQTTPRDDATRSSASTRSASNYSQPRTLSRC